MSEEVANHYRHVDGRHTEIIPYHSITRLIYTTKKGVITSCFFRYAGREHGDGFTKKEKVAKFVAGYNAWLEAQP